MRRSKVLGFDFIDMGTDDGHPKQRLLPSFTVLGDGSAKSPHYLNSTYASASATSTPRPQALIVFSKQDSGQASIGK